MNRKKWTIVNIAKEIAGFNKPFTVKDVLIKLDNSYTPYYAARKLYELSTGSFPILQRITKTKHNLLEIQYISINIKLPTFHQRKPGMNEQDFHKCYGCFGVKVVKNKKGLVIWDKSESNRVRKIVESYLRFHKLNYTDRQAWLKDLIHRINREVPKRSIQIGIIQALQNNGVIGQEVYDVINELCNGVKKAHSLNDIWLRNNAASYRKSLIIYKH